MTTRTVMRRPDARRIALDDLREMARQHREIYALVERLYRLGPARYEDFVLPALLAQLINCVSRHFASEERLLRAARHPDFASQRRAHRQILDGMRAQRAGLQPWGRDDVDVDLRRALDALLIHGIADDEAMAMPLNGPSSRVSGGHTPS